MHINEAFARKFAKHESGVWRVNNGRLEAQRGLEGDVIEWIAVSIVDADYLPAQGWVDWDGKSVDAPLALWWVPKRAA